MIRNSFFQQQKYLYLVFFIFFAQFFLLDIYYFDDLFRVQDGTFGWRSDGRALGGFFYKILIQFRSPLADVYPFPLIIAGILFCYMCYLGFIGFGVTNQKQQVLILLAIISSPLALANWLFRYDSAFMLLSVGFSILPFYFAEQGNKKFWGISVLSLIGSLTTYQIAINIFIGLTAIYAFKLAVENSSLRKTLQFIGIAALAFIIAYIIYSQIILRIMPMHNYAASFQTLPEFKKLNNIIFNNIKEMLPILYSLLKSGLFAPLILAILFNIYCLLKLKNNQLLLITLYFIALLTVIFAIAGVMLVSPNNPFYARTYLGVIPLLIFPSIVLLLLNYKKLFYISIIFMCLTTTIIDRAGLNATVAEFKLHNSISNQVITELSINHVQKVDHIMIIGSPPLSNAALLNSKTFPVIKYILPITFNNGYDGGRYVMMFNDFPRITYPNHEMQKSIMVQLDSMVPIASNSIYKLYYIDQIPIIKFH